MSERFNYAKNGVLKVYNIEEHIINNDFPYIEIGTIAGIEGWCFEMKVFTFDDQIYLRPFICCPDKPKCFIRFIFTVIKENGSPGSSMREERFFEPLRGLYGPRMFIRNLLTDGSLDEDGGLLITYGIQVLSILGNDGIWKFNFLDSDEENMMKFMQFFCHKQILSFHSSNFESFSRPSQGIKNWAHNSHDTFEKFLQIAHGVQIQEQSIEEICTFIELAGHFLLPNVIRYCERTLIEMDHHPIFIRFAIFLNWNHYLAELIRKVKSSKELKSILEDVDIQKISGEAMKQFTKFFYAHPN